MIELAVSKKFKNFKMDFSFKLNTDRAVIFGPSGCGKTSLLKMITGFIKPDHGQIKVNGKDVFNSAENFNCPVYLRNFGYLTQEYTLFPNMTVRENILYGIKTKKIPLSGDKFDRIIERLQIASKLNDMPGDLSGGQKQRVALARILMIKPDLLLLDEPFTALDVPIRNCLRDLVVDFSEEENIPVLFVSHDIDDTYAIGKEIIVIDNGTIIEYGETHSIVDRPENVRTAQLFDYRNIWPVQRVDKNKIYIKNNIFFNMIPDPRENFKYLCLKPDKIKLTDSCDKNNNETACCFEGYVSEIHYRGKYNKIQFVADAGITLEIYVSNIYFHQLDIKKERRLFAVIDKHSVTLCKSGLTMNANAMFDTKKNLKI